ncbi:heterodisulfide reductase-related iron-sulfur binding cluster [Halococcus saccharolyticus]|uniref:Fe-S oxidoreductase n=1 Tax=Halococcus saccharolyticus DSM 5350 TaxID=1227455 RepID=M0MEW2_9EURY|nr:(Fe-S)-binding protein [Halococcus saccharolyticus]EMA43878.1 Fe-S oxidoreductase [Halococcus saccharolyticus DSM 5350]
MTLVLQAGETVTRETFWLIGPVGKALFYFLTALAVTVFLYGVYERFARYTRGTEDAFSRLDDLPNRIVSAAKTVITNENQFNRDLYGGLMHAFIMWGFLTLLIGTTILAIDMDGYQLVTGLLGETQSFFVGDFYLSYSLVMDAMGFLFVIGLGMAIYRRYVVRNERLWGKHTSVEDGLFVWTLFLLAAGGYLVEGVRILATGFPEFETVSFVGWFVALVLQGIGVSEGFATTLYPAAWWSHSLLALGFVAWVPYAKPFHMLSSFANVVTRDEKAGTRLPGVPADADPDEIGFTGIEDMSWRQMLDQDACTKCGRCSSVCPAKASGRPLDPRDVILDLKSYRESVNAGGETKEIVADGGTSVINPRTMESCMSCMACMDACPVDIEHVPQFTEMNRRLTESGEMDENVQETMMDIFGQGNSFGDPERKRPEWTEELDFEVPDARDEPVEYLWYVGDYPSYDERNRRVARSLATIFEHAGVDYGILYEDEQNDGNDVRRVGEEGLYEMLAEDNVDAFESCEFDTIVCTDPHSYNTFSNEYPELDGVEWNQDGEIDVHHYTQVVQELADSGALDLRGTELDHTVTYHDPCHLGRMNDEYEAPRNLVRRTGCDLNEMPRNRANSFCCGGGGGGLWMDFDEEPKPSEERLREALEDTDAGAAVEKFVVACPMCMTMYEDGRKTGSFEDEIEIVGLSELLAEAIDAGGAAGATADADADAETGAAPADD